MLDTAISYERCRLEQVCLLITDGKHGDCQNEEGSGFYFLSAKDVRDGELHYEDARQITREDFMETHRRTRLEPLDILISNSGTIGRMAIAKDIDLTRRTTFQKSVAIIKADTARVDPLWLFYCLSNAKEDLINAAGGTAQKNLLLRDLRSFRIELPPLPVQRKIADILSAYDDLIENNTRRIKILEEMAQSLYREWFMHFRFPGHEGVRLVESELGLVPEGWAVRSFGDVALNFDSKRKPLSSLQRAEMQGAYPYYGAARVFDYINDYIFDGKYLLIAEDGSVITEDRRPVLQFVEGKFWPNNHTHVVQGTLPFSTEYIYLVMCNVDISGYITGAAQPKITQANLNRIPILAPSRNLLDVFNGIVASYFSAVRVLERKNINLRRTRDLLLPGLISGEVDVAA